MKSSIRSMSVLSGALVALGAASARADGPADDASGGGIDHHVAAVSGALEIGLGGGYGQGTGDIGRNSARVQDLSGPGGTLELKLGYRVIPNLAIGGYGTYSQFQANDAMPSGDVRSATAGVFADWHFRPDRSVDPWIGLASGWRGMWLVPDAGPNTSIQGWEIARLQAGLDYRITPEVAIGPVIGASVNTFFTRDSGNGFQDIGDPQANFYFFGGLQARFDVLGDRHTHAGGQAEQAAR